MFIVYSRDSPAIRSGRLIGQDTLQNQVLHMKRRKSKASSSIKGKRRRQTQPAPRGRKASGFEQLERRDLMALTFNFIFDADGSIGFNHPTSGTARRAALNQAATEFGSWFPSYTKTIDVLVHNENQGILRAHAGGRFADTFPNSGFDMRVPQRKILGPGT